MHFSLIPLQFFPPGSGSAFRMRIQREMECGFMLTWILSLTIFKYIDRRGLSNLMIPQITHKR